MTKLIGPLIFLVFIVSCGKYECVTTSSPEMIGEWSHIAEGDIFHRIYIQENGRGYMHGLNHFGHYQDTQGRGWYIKDDVLYFSRFQNKVEEDMFTIDQYPIVSDTIIITGIDTIPAGTTYMILNGWYYKKG